MEPDEDTPTVSQAQELSHFTDTLNELVSVMKDVKRATKSLQGRVDKLEHSYTDVTQPLKDVVRNSQCHLRELGSLYNDSQSHSSSSRSRELEMLAAAQAAHNKASEKWGAGAWCVTIGVLLVIMVMLVVVLVKLSQSSAKDTTALQQLVAMLLLNSATSSNAVLRRSVSNISL